VIPESAGESPWSGSVDPWIPPAGESLLVAAVIILSLYNFIYHKVFTNLPARRLGVDPWIRGSCGSTQIMQHAVSL